MWWNSFSSFFQLSAAFCLTYTVIETFTANFNKKIYEVDNYFMTDILNDFEKGVTENYRWLLNKKFSTLLTGQVVFDPLANEIKSIIDRHKALFFHVFIACILFLVFTAFENFYHKDVYPNIDKKICGLIIIPFISLIGFLFLLQSVKNQNNINKELSTWRNTISTKLESFSLSIKIHLVFLSLGLLIIWLLPANSEMVFSATKSKLIIAFCIISIFLPFVTQYFQIKKTIKRYETAATKLRQTFNPAPISVETDANDMKEKIKALIKKE